MEIDPSLVETGLAIFESYCINCHNIGERYPWFSQYPNLAMLVKPTHTIFKKIVLEGAYAQNGMASFADILDESDVDAIQHFLISEQTQLYQEQQNKQQ